MTIATQLFYHQRSRTNRDSEPEAELDATLRLSRGRRSNGGHHRREDCDSSRRFHPGTHHGRHLPHHRASPAVHEQTWFDHRGTSEFGAGNRSSGGIPSCRDSRPSLTRDVSDDRLPGAVVQARARLLERLRSVYVTGSRQSTSSSGISRNELSCSGDSSVIVSGYWKAETQRECFESGLDLCDMNKKPSGLGCDKLGLQHEVFRHSEEGVVAKTSFECCICLERFLEGDGLVRLQCGHRFHPICLEPWVRTHGDCPYCRSGITC